LWKNGFTFDDGPLRDYNDSGNANFIDAIKRGQIPREIQQLGNDILVELQDSRGQDWVEPPKVLKPFSGQGQKLGSATTNSNSMETKTSSIPSSPPLQIDDSKPVTTILIRCADGTRLSGKFNHFHTIQDIRRFIDSSKGSKLNYDICYSFPQKVISDENLTIEAAALVNSVVIQKLK